MNNDLPPSGTRVALIAGPTASGKSALAIAVARQRPAVIVNADSAQVYRDLRILSARPSPTDEAAVPHRLFGHIDGAEAYSAARWAADARTEIATAAGEGRLPILAGGTGLYLRTLLDGIAPMPAIDDTIRREVRALPVADAYQALIREDAAAAARLAPADTTRVARALEVVRSTGRTLAAWQAAREGGIGDRIRLTALILLPPREILFARTDRRFLDMLDMGAIDEVEALQARGLDPALPVMRAIGVPEIAAWQNGAIDRSAMIERAQIATRQYAKRQYTWFRHQPPADWTRVDAQLNDDNIDDIAIKLSEDRLTA